MSAFSTGFVEGYLGYQAEKQERAALAFEQELAAAEESRQQKLFDAKMRNLQQEWSATEERQALVEQYLTGQEAIALTEDISQKQFNLRMERARIMLMDPSAQIRMQGWRESGVDMPGGDVSATDRVRHAKSQFRVRSAPLRDQIAALEMKYGHKRYDEYDQADRDKVVVWNEELRRLENDMHRQEHRIYSEEIGIETGLGPSGPSPGIRGGGELPDYAPKEPGLSFREADPTEQRRSFRLALESVQQEQPQIAQAMLTEEQRAEARANGDTNALARDAQARRLLLLQAVRQMLASGWEDLEVMDPADMERRAATARAAGGGNGETQPQDTPRMDRPPSSRGTPQMDWPRTRPRPTGGAFSGGRPH